MALETFIVTANTKAPYVRATGMPHRPQAVEFKQFRRGDMIKGELKHANNQPAFVLVAGCLVVPLSVLKKVVTKEISSNADGSQEKPKEKTIKSVAVKATYIDGVLMGAVAGAVITYLCEKQGWIVAPAEGGNKNKLYGALFGAVAGAYIVYKIKQNKPQVIKKEE
jgi:hypothetical protein